VSRFLPGKALAAAAVGIGAAVAIFALHHASLHDVVLHGADDAELDRVPVGLAAPGTGHGQGDEAPRSSLSARSDAIAWAEREGDNDTVSADSADGEAVDVRAGHAGAELEQAARPSRSPHGGALRHPSEAFRNASLLALIRDAGYLCVDIVSSAAWNESASAWRVSCEGVHAYIVIELDNGSFLVEPLETYDAPVPNPITLPSDRLPPLEPR